MYFKHQSSVIFNVVHGSLEAFARGVLKTMDAIFPI